MNPMQLYSYLGKAMSYFKIWAISLFLLSAGCSTQVEDKNAELSSSAKKALIEQSNQDAFEVTEVKFETTEAIREDASNEANIIAKYYTIKVCLEDKKIAKELKNRNVYIDGEKKVTDTKGCVRWDETIEFDFKENGRCKVIEKTIKISDDKIKKFRYSIDSFNDSITDLNKSAGCTKKTKITKKNTLNYPIVFGDMSLVYGAKLSEHSSDLRYKKFETLAKACLYIAQTGKPLRFTSLRIKFTNLETKEISMANGPLIQTDISGCFSISFNVQYEQYKYSHWMEYTAEVTVLNGIMEGAKTVRNFFINPWEPLRSHFGIGDGRYPPTPHQFKNEYARFHLDGVMYIQIGNDTQKMKVNDYLGLTIAKTYQVVLNPYVNREYRYTDEKQPIQRLHSEGNFKLSMVILAPKKGDIPLHKENFEDFEYITGAQKIVTVRNGVINELMTIPFPMIELPRLALRTMSLFKIEPITDSGLRSTIVTGVFKARIPWIKTNVFQSRTLNEPDYIQEVWDKAFKNLLEGQKLPTKGFTADEIENTCSRMKNIEKRQCTEGIKEIIDSEYDEKAIAYNKWVDGMFARLVTEEDDVIKNTEKKITGKEIFVNHLAKTFKDIKLLTMKEAKENYGINLKPNDYDTLLPENFTYDGMTQNMINEVCEYGFNRGAILKINNANEKKIVLKHCKQHPSDFFDAQSYRHVEKVNRVGESYTNGFTINFGESYGVSSTDGDYITDNTSVFYGYDTGTKIDIPFLSQIPVIGKILPNFGGKAGKTWAHNEGHTVSDGFQLTERIGSDKSLTVEKFVVNVHGNFERCVLIVAKDFNKTLHNLRMKMWAWTVSWGRRGPFKSKDEFEKYFYPKDTYNETLYICDDNVREEKYTEAWYFVQSRVDSSIGRDTDGIVERKVIKAFRSEKMYYQFRQAIRDISEKNLVFDTIAHGTPEDMLIKHWGYLLGNKFTKKDAAKFLVKNFEGSFPGTLEGRGSTEYIIPEEVQELN